MAAREGVEGEVLVGAQGSKAEQLRLIMEEVEVGAAFTTADQATRVL